MIAQRFKVSRLEAISDGVFAIAMTLLVLDLKLQGVDHDIDADLFAAALNNQLPQFVSWIISLAILCRLWMTQHALLKNLPEESSLFTWLNFGFLGGVSFNSTLDRQLVFPYCSFVVSELYLRNVSA